MPFGPLELYLAGWIPAEEVPDVWVARDGRWTGERDDDGYRVFSASNPEMWTAKRVVEEYGIRTPTHENSQRTFRAAAILLVEEEHPLTDAVLADFTEEVRRFTHPGNDDHEAINFWEATGGRATIVMGDLSNVRRNAATVPQRAVAMPVLHRVTTSAQGPVLRKDTPVCPEHELPIDHFDDRPGHYPPRGRK